MEVGKADEQFVRSKGSDIEKSSKLEEDEERMRSEEQSRDRLVTKWLNEVQIHDHPLPDEGFKIPRELQEQRERRSPKQGGTAQFEGAGCSKPANLMSSDQEEADQVQAGCEVDFEKEVCPTKMYCGQQYDFRCIYCNVLPRKGMVSRSELYRHYAIKHFREQLKSEYGDLASCPICGTEKNGPWEVRMHLGQVHDKVENYLPEEAKIPNVFQRNLRKHASMKTSGVVSKAKKRTGIFPVIPESSCSGFEPKEKHEAEESNEKEKLSPDFVDGFMIEVENVIEEAEELGHPHSDENLKCAVCDEMFSKGVLNEAVKHLEELHGVRRGLQLNLGLSRLISAGYLLRPAHSTGF